MSCATPEAIFVLDWRGPLLAVATSVTALEIVLGFALSVVVGHPPLPDDLPVDVPFAHAVLPLLISSQAMPRVAFAPLLLVWFGFGLPKC